MGLDVGVIVGKFMPFTFGHDYLIQESSKRCNKIYVLVCSRDDEPIDGALRYSWLKKHYKGNEHIIIKHVPANAPNLPEDDVNFWPIWIDIVNSNAPDRTVLFSSENYGDTFAKCLGIPHVPIDIHRTRIPISGTKVRNSPLKNWKYLPTVVKPHYTKKIALMGPESTGKTMLAAQLAKHYNCLWNEEFGRLYCEDIKRKLTIEDISSIAAGHLHNEEHRLLQNASMDSKIFISDTELITTQIWSELYFDECPEWIIEKNHRQNYDLYLLMDIDVPWVADTQRDFPNRRKEHFCRIKSELISRKLNFWIVSGCYEDRLKNAIDYIDYTHDITTDYL